MVTACAWHDADAVVLARAPEVNPPIVGGLKQNIYEVASLIRAKCQGRMPIISFIENPEIIKKYPNISICGN